FCCRRCSMSLPINVLLPTPALPVTAITRLGLADAATAKRLSRCSPRAASVNNRASARRSPWRKRSMTDSVMSGLRWLDAGKPLYRGEPSPARRHEPHLAPAVWEYHLLE